MNLLTWTAKRLARAGDASDTTFAERDGLFTVQTLDTEAIASLAAQAFRESGSPTWLRPGELVQLLELPDTRAILFELFTARLLEWPETLASQLRNGIRDLVATEFSDLESHQIESTADQIYRCLYDTCSYLLRHVDAADTEMRAAIQQLAGISNLASTAKSIERHLAGLSRPPAITAQYPSFTNAYRSFLKYRHGWLTLPDFEVERRVPVDTLFVEPRLFADGQSIEFPSALTLHSRVVVKGNPGAGKSTLAGVTILRLAQDPSLLPFMVVLREYGSDYDEGASIVEHIVRMTKLRMQAEPPAEWVDAMLLNGNSVVVFDGLDELVNPQKRREIRDAVEQFAAHYPLARILVTSREVGYEQAPLTDREFLTVELGDLDDAGMRKYVQSWFDVALDSLDSNARSERVENFIKESSAVEEIRRNPLMLSLMCVLYRGTNYIPESRLALYDECAKLLFKKWDRSRGIHVELEIGAHIDAALGYLAYWILTEGHAEQGVPESRLVERCAQYLVPRRYENVEDAQRVAQQFVQFCRGRAWVLADAGVTESGERLYTFTHRTFLEFYSAQHLNRVAGTPEAVAEVLLPYISSERFDVVGQLSVQMAERNHDDGADRVLSAFLSAAISLPEVEKRRTLTFICRVLGSQAIAPAVLRDVVKTVVDFSLNSSEPDQTSRHLSKDGLPLSQLLIARRANLDVIADEMRKVLTPYIDGFGTEKSSQYARAFTIAALARSLAGHVAADKDYYFDYWGAWSLDIFAEWPPFEEHTLDRTWLPARVAAVEVGLTDFSKCMAAEELVHLVDSVDGGVIGFSRVGTLRLLAGWLVGDYIARVFLPGIPSRILRDLPALLAATSYQITVPGAPHVQFGVTQRRLSRLVEIQPNCFDGAALVLAMFLERLEDQPSDVFAEWATDCTAGSRILRLVDSLRVTRVNGDAPVNTELLEGVLHEESGTRLQSEVREVLRSWAMGAHHFFVIESEEYED